MHRTQKRRYNKRRHLLRVIKRAAIGLTGIFLLVFLWKGTSNALSFFSPDHNSFDEEMRVSERMETETGKETAVSSAAMDSSEDILLVNKDHPLDDNYHPSLIKMHDYGVEVDRSIYDALNEMLAAGEKQGLSFWVASGYRSMERQRELLDEDIEELVQQGYSFSEAYEEVVKETMPVGCSEHATGLSIDIVSKGYQILDEKQADTEEIKWLQKNCSQYGFILRYPEGKEDITKVSYESWHFRYVGEKAAKTITEQGLTLEEYLDQII